MHSRCSALPFLCRLPGQRTLSLQTHCLAGVARGVMRLCARSRCESTQLRAILVWVLHALQDVLHDHGSARLWSLRSPGFVQVVLCSMVHFQ